LRQFFSPRSPEQRSWKRRQAGLADPTLEAFEWRELRKAPVFDQAPSFVIATKCRRRERSRSLLDLRFPVFVLSNDPRGWAFLDDSANFAGRNGVIVTPAADLTSALSVAEPYFARLGQPQFQTLDRHGRPEVNLALIPADGLTRGLPMFYPGATGR
jgi:hypothetical protein